MSSLTESLRQVMTVDGVRAAALVDIATGMVVEAVGGQAQELPAAAATLAEEARVTRALLGPDRPGGQLEEIALLTEGRLHLSRVLDYHLGDGVLLFVDLDRTRGNMALTSLRIGQLAPAILA